jgi:hypothetical protein
VASAAQLVREALIFEGKCFFESLPSLVLSRAALQQLLLLSLCYQAALLP